MFSQGLCTRSWKAQGSEPGPSRPRAPGVPGGPCRGACFRASQHPSQAVLTQGNGCPPRPLARLVFASKQTRPGDGGPSRAHHQCHLTISLATDHSGWSLGLRPGPEVGRALPCDLGGASGPAQLPGQCRPVLCMTPVKLLPPGLRVREPEAWIHGVSGQNRSGGRELPTENSF